MKLIKGMASRQTREIDPTPAEQREWIERGLKERNIAGNVGRILMRYYPGYNWEVEVEIRGGIVAVRNLSLDGIWGFVIHLSKLMQSPDTAGDVIMRAGGEILERYNLARGARQNGTVETLDRDARGNAIGDKDAAPGH